MEKHFNAIGISWIAALEVFEQLSQLLKQSCTSYLAVGCIRAHHLLSDSCAYLLAAMLTRLVSRYSIRSLVLLHEESTTRRAHSLTPYLTAIKMSLLPPELIIYGAVTYNAYTF